LPLLLLLPFLRRHPGAKRRIPVFRRCFALAVAVAVVVNVISTEGGALCRRSGEIPVFRISPLHIALLFPR
jgi:hypothetical protein